MVDRLQPTKHSLRVDRRRQHDSSITFLSGLALRHPAIRQFIAERNVALFGAEIGSLTFSDVW